MDFGFIVGTGALVFIVLWVPLFFLLDYLGIIRDDGESG